MSQPTKPSQVPSLWQVHRKECSAAIVIVLALAVISLIIAQKTGIIDLVKFGQTKAGVITYSVIGGTAGAIGLAVLRLYFKRKTFPVSQSEMGNHKAHQTASSQALTPHPDNLQVASTSHRRGNMDLTQVYTEVHSSQQPPPPLPSSSFFLLPPMFPMSGSATMSQVSISPSDPPKFIPVRMPSRLPTVVQHVSSPSSAINRKAQGPAGALLKAFEEGFKSSDALATAIKLIADGVRFDTSFEDDVRLLLLAVSQKRVDIIPHLIDAGARLNRKNEDEETPLLKAVAKDDLEMATLLLAKGAEANFATKDGTRVPLHLAVLNGNEAMVLLLIANGAGVNWMRPNCCMTALKWAVVENNQSMVKLLLSQGAEIDFAGDSYTPLQQAVINNNSTMVTLLLDKKAKINCTNNNGRTALFLASRTCHIEMVKMLIDANADPNIYDKWGFAPIHEAYANRNAAIFESLKKSGAKWDLPTGHEISDMSLLASAWGIGGFGMVSGQAVEREGQVYRTPPLLALADVLKEREPKIAAAFAADWDLDLISRLEKIRDGELKDELVVIRTGWKTHAIVLVFYRGYLAICNRGPGGPTQVYKVDPSKITSELLNQINEIASQEKRPAIDFLYKTLPEALAGSQEDSICHALNHGDHLKPQIGGFCSYDSPEDALYTIFALQELLKGGDIQNAKSAYKWNTTYLRLEFLNRYLKKIKDKQIRISHVDFELLEKIHLRLTHPYWHPARFKDSTLSEERERTITRLEEVLALKPLKPRLFPFIHHYDLYSKA